MRYRTRTLDLVQRGFDGVTIALFAPIKCFLEFWRFTRTVAQPLPFEQAHVHWRINTAAARRTEAPVSFPLSSQPAVALLKPNLVPWPVLHLTGAEPAFHPSSGLLSSPNPRFLHHVQADFKKGPITLRDIIVYTYQILPSCAPPMPL